MLAARTPIKLEVQKEIESVVNTVAYEQLNQEIKQKRKEEKKDYYLFNGKESTANNLNWKIINQQKKTTKNQKFPFISSNEDDKIYNRKLLYRRGLI